MTGRNGSTQIIVGTGRDRERIGTSVGNIVEISVGTVGKENGRDMGRDMGREHGRENSREAHPGLVGNMIVNANRVCGAFIPLEGNNI